MTVAKQIVNFHVWAPDMANDVAGLGTRADFLYQNSLEFPGKIRVVCVNFERVLARLALAQSLKPILCQNHNVLARAADRAFVAVLNNIPTERLDHLRKQQDLRGEGTDEIILVRDCVRNAQHMETIAHTRDDRLTNAISKATHD